MQGLYRDTLSASHALGDTAEVGDSLHLGNLPWRELFCDPALQTLIEQGLSRNTDLTTAYLRIKQSEATRLSSRLSYLPSLQLNPEGTLSNFNRQSTTRTYQLPLAASWEVDLFGQSAQRQARCPSGSPAK